MLEIISSYHNRWISILEKFGCKDYSEDLVQEMYIRVHKYGKENKVILNGSVNFSYIYFMLKNIYLDFIREKNKIKIVEDFEFLKIVQNEEEKDYETELIFINSFDTKINQLPHYDKILFTLRYKHKKTFREIEKNTGISKDELCKDWKRIRMNLNEELINDYNNLKNGNE
jgi:RNA polymerase sigma factor (sigma-70 family)